MSERTIEQLRSMQCAPLSVKVLLTKQRIRDWVREYGEDGVYVAFSGGKDSTVLLNIVREDYPDVPAVFSDTGLEYPEIREFVRTFDNVEWVRPKMNFRQVIEKYGYPFISKEVSETIEDAKKYLQNVRGGDCKTEVPCAYAMADVLGVERRKNTSDEYLQLKQGIIPSRYKFGKPGQVLQLEGKVPRTENGKVTNEFSQRYNKAKWRFLLNAPFNVSKKCCSVMKKAPLNSYARKEKRHPMTAQMAEESALRLSNWIRHGCNAFDSKRPISNPMAFWTEQDVLLYIKQNNIPICSVYGDIVEKENVRGQLTIADYDAGEYIPELETTGAQRTGCMFCGYGCHLEKGEGRFERMKRTHPKQYNYIMKPWEDGGLGYKAVIDWINENGGTNIRY